MGKTPIRIARCLRRGAGVAIIFIASGCATNLTEGGRKIRVITYDGGKAVSGCQPLAQVRGEAGSFLNSGDYGIFYATLDARNKAATIPSADTLALVDPESRRFGGEVTGTAYRCAAGDGRAAQGTSSVTPGPALASPNVAGAATPVDARAIREGAPNQPVDAGGPGAREATPVQRRSAAVPSREIVEKARKCQDKGGIWVNDLCVLPVE